MLAPKITTSGAMTPARVRRPRRWLWRIAVLFALLAAAVWFAPAVAARTGLLNRVARSALSDLRGTVEVGGASLGWLAPVELRDVTVKDAQGRTLLTVPKVTSSRSLLALARNQTDLGEFTVERPAVEVVCEADATNLEHVLAHWLKDETAAGGPRPAVAIRVIDGKLTLLDGDKSSEFTSLEAAVSVPAARTEPVAVKLSAVAPAGSPGKLDADLSLGDGGTAKLTAAGFPLGSLAPLFKRVEPGITATGQLTADLSAKWGTDDKGRPMARVEGVASLRELDLSGSRLNGDRLRLTSVELPLAGETVGKGVRVERANLTCDVGTLSAAGAFDPDEPLDKLLDRPGLRVEADVDLAKLAALLPRLLRLREGTAIREGRLAVKLASRTTDAGTTWDGSVRTSALKAERDGRPIDWAEPLSVEFAGRVPAGHLPTFDKFVCRSDFIAIKAEGSPESFRAAANVYLDRLAARLGEFVDLGGAKLSGVASPWVIASRSPKGEFKADAGAELKQFTFSDGHEMTLNEPVVSVKASASGTWPAHGPITVGGGSATLTAGADTLDVNLVDLTTTPGQPVNGLLRVKLTGDLARWVARARGFVSIPPEYVFGGSTSANGTVRIRPGVLTSNDLRVTIEQARFRGAGLDIAEPYLNATADTTLDTATGTTDFTKLKISSPTLHVNEGRLLFEMVPGKSLAVVGTGPASAELVGLGRTLRLSSDPKGSDAFRGRATGPIRFRWQGDTTTFGGTLDIKDFAYGDPAKTGIAEPAMKLDLDGKYDQTPDRVTLTRARLERTGLAVDAAGTVAKFDTTQDVDLKGTLTYDLAKLTPELRNALGGGFQAAGLGSRPFALAGSLGTPGGVAAKVGSPPSPLGKLTADAALGWDTIKAYGFDVGQGELKVKLAGGLATVSSVRASFGGGVVTLTPSARLHPDPAEVWFAKGKAVDRAKLTPAICAGALGYALPAIANATQATGEISATLEDNRIPLGDVTKASLKGQLIVHKATVSPGPVVTEIAKLLGATSTTMTLANEMTVPVRVEGGRVYHENLAVNLNGYVVKTTGSVGFDQSLALVAEVPIPGTLPGLKNNPAMKQALEGKVVKVPIAGTMAKPAIDPRQFQAAVADLTRGAVKSAGKDILNKELEKLLPGLPFPKK